MNSVSKKVLLLLSGLAIAIALIAPGIASAAGEPNISLEMHAPEDALLGTKQTVSLVAKNPTGQPRGYNLSFRDVLPKGVKYVPGSAKGPNGEALEVRVIPNAPNAANEETTLLIENVSDLSANSEYGLTFEVEPSVAEYGLNKTYENNATAYVSRRARYKPKFNANGEVITGEESFKGFESANAKTTLTAIEIEKEEISPEGEILRGVHEHKVVYTLHLRNNEVKKTTNLQVDDYLPAGLEFLGCGTEDHTKISPTTGTSEEYAGSGEIFTGKLPEAPSCLEPSEVMTEEVDPDGPEGPLPPGVYTHVVWSELGELEPGAEREIQYRAAIPILENTLSWPQGEPTKKSLEQAANLDNNSGAETYDEEPLTNYSTVNGLFNGEAGAKAKDADSLTRTAEDLAIQKTVKPDTIAEGQLSEWTFEIETSEYRYVNNVQVEDTLPNGLCPVGAANYEMPIELKAECEPNGKFPTSEYTSVQEQSDGTWKILWNKAQTPQLAHMAPSTTFKITFPTVTRTYYQKEFRDSLKEPVLTGDSWTNDVDTFGENFARCAPGDPSCTEATPKIPTHKGWVEGSKVEDVSSASQEAGGVAIDKTVRENTGGTVPADCSGTYVEGTGPTFPKYAPGDKICWDLRVNFAAALYAGTPAVTDFLPPNEKFLAGSAQEVKPPSNVESTIDETEAEGGALEWALGAGSVESGAKVWEWRFATEMGTSLESKPEDITGNLMKFVYSNHFGQTFPLRDRAEIQREEPELQLTKGVYSVGGVPAGGKGPDQNATGAHGGEKVKYRLDLKNTGNLVAENIELWDRLPAGIECSDVVAGSVSNGGECKTGNIIVWTGLEVAKEGAIPSVTYEVTLPTDVAPNQTYVNTAGVRQFQSPTNTGTPFTYYPAENIDPTFEAEHTPNTGKIKDPATVSTEEVGLVKNRTTTINQGGNNVESQATIGETVNYTIEAKVPAGSQLFGSPKLTDPLGERLLLVPGTAKGKVKVGGTTTEIPNKVVTAGFTATEEGGNPVLIFPTTFTNPPGEGAATVTLEFSARVADVAANNRTTGASITNVATLNWQDQNLTPKSKTSQVTTTVVEPNVGVKKQLTGSEIVKPGETRAWTVTAENKAGTNVSTANNSTVVDTVPAGLTPFKGGVEVAEGGLVGSVEEGGIWSGTARTITWTISELAPGATKALHYELRVNEPANAGAIFKNSAVIKTTSLQGGVAGERTASSPSHAGYEAEAKSEARLNDATLEKAVEAPEDPTIGSPLTYTLKLKLPPSITFFDTTVEDQLPKGITHVAPPVATITCSPSCPEVAAAGQELKPKVTGGAQLLGWYFGKVEQAAVERTVTITYTAHIDNEVEGAKILDKAKLQNKAIGLYSGEAKLGTPPTEPPERGKFTNKTNEPNAEVEVKEPKLAIVKSVTGESEPATSKTQPGDEYTYTLKVTNGGDAPAYDVVVKDNNPQGVLRGVNPQGVEGSSSLVPGWKTGDPLEWIVGGPIEPGASVNLEYKAKIAPSSELHQGDKIENIADVPLYWGVPEAQREAEPTTPKEIEEGKTRYREYKEDPKDTVTLDTELPKLALVKTVTPEEAEIGKPLTWHIKVTNSASVAGLFGVKIVDTLPKGFEYKENSTTGVTTANPTITEVGEAEVLTWENVVPSLAATESQTLNFEAPPTLALAREEGSFENKAVATGKDASGEPGSFVGPYKAEGTATVNLITPGLNINKTPDVPDPAADAVAGEPSAYTLEITNSGTAVATGVEVSDLMGAGNDYTANSATAEPAAGFTETGVESLPAGETKVKWTIASIPASGKVIIHVPVALAASIPDGTKLVDNASVISAQEKTPKTNEGSLLVHREAQLTIEKKGPATAVAGEQIEYEINVNNAGPSEAENVVIHDRVPAGLKFITGDLPCKEATGGGEVICELGNLAKGAPGRPYDITFEVLSATTGTVSNKARVSTSTEPPLGGNKEPESEVTTTVETEGVVVVHKTAPKVPVLLGSTFVYTLEVENEGPSDALGVEVEDKLPPQVEALKVETDTGTCEPAASTIKCELGTLTPVPAPGSKATILITVKAIGIPTGGAPVVNTATATSATPDPTVPKGVAEVTVEPAADLAVTKTAPETVPADGEITYGLHVVNNGPSDATGVKLTDPLPAGTQFVSASENCTEAGGTITCEVGELKVGEERDYKVTVKAPLTLAGQPLVNTATVKGEQADPESKNDQSTVTTTVGPAADLSITKTMGKAEAGKPLVYTLAITNHGPSASSAVTVKDSLPAGTTFKSAAPSQGTCSASGQSVICQLGALASGASAQVSITVEVAATATGTIRNVAGVEGPEPDPDMSNNESAVEGPITPVPPAATGTPNLKVVKTADTSTPQVGVPFDYDVAISNTGDAEAKNVKVVDTLSGPVKVVSIQAGPGKCAAEGSKIECTIPSVAVGKTVHVTYSVVAESTGALSNT
ncbi:MAG TPA: isopeptide-forming domain-containing fimbrial protein, partial [Solirubrobacterales bacterium]